MAGQAVYSSDDEAPPPKSQAPPKPPRKSRDDVSGNQTFATRTRDQRQPSQKQNTTDKENLEATMKRLEKAQKDYEKAKRLLSKQAKVVPQQAAGDDSLESEEEQRSDDNNAVSFQSSIRPLAALPPEAPRPVGVVRKSTKKAHAPPKTSSRAFLTLPEIPPSTTTSDHSEPSSPTVGNMDPDFDDPPLSDGAANTSDLGGERDRHRDANDAASSSTDRGRSSRGTTTPATSRKRANQSSPPPPPPSKRQRREPQFAEGYEAIAGAKPKAADYEPTVRALLLRAMLEYAMRIMTIKAFPDAGLQVTWAHECFKNACRAANERFRITERMSKLIAKRGSHIRSQFITVIRVLYAKHYNFNRTSTSPAAIKTNRDLSEKLNDGAAFHYKDVDAGTGYAGNTIFSDIRSAVLFKNKTSIGAVFASHFSPYPIPTLALEFTCLDHCNSEWSTGRLVPAPFEEKYVLKKYTMHLNDIGDWAELNKSVVDNLRAKWYTRASRTLQGPAPDVSTNISEARADALREELAGRTGLTDSETEEADAEQ